MDSSIETPAVQAAAASTPQARVSARLDHSFDLRDAGDPSAARVELEAAMDDARATPDAIEFPTRVQLAMELADVYELADEIEKARELLVSEMSFAGERFQRTVATGTLAEKRAAAGWLTQLRDRATQVWLIGREAPELSIQTWINSDPVLLADLRGRVVLLEFWATWCKPCQEMFPKLKKLHEEYGARGLTILMLTRHYLAQRDAASTVAEEVELIRKVVHDNGLELPVGIAEDERVQNLYGATGVPTLALIDREGIVRYAYFGGEDDRFDQILNRCLEEPPE